MRPNQAARHLGAMRQSHRAVLLARIAGGGQWKSAAACGSADPDLFFPVPPSGHHQAQVAKAKALCADCPVRGQCLDYAVQTSQRHGIWGGMTEEERYRVLRRTRAQV